KRMTTVIRHASRRLSLVKGAPEWVLSQCVTYQDGAEARPLAEAFRERIRGRLDAVARQAMRTLAFAYRVVPDDMPESEEGLHDRRGELERDLVYLGFVAIRDPLRDDVKNAIDACRAAGIQVKIITGDNVETARAISHDVGLVASL